MANIKASSDILTTTPTNNSIFGEIEHLYSVRIDSTASYDTAVLLKFLEKIKPFKYLFGREVGTTGGRHHFQGVIWCKEKYSQSFIVKVRNMVSYQLLKDLDYGSSKKCQPISFCYSKNPKSLVSYCAKDQDLFTDLLPAEVKSIPSWLEKRDYKLELKAQLHIVLAKIIKEKRIVCAKHPLYHTFCHIFHKEYLKVYGKHCFYRNTFYASALEHKVISIQIFLEKIGVITDMDYPHHSWTDDHEAIM